ncbi:MAG: head GIN domain-containing protein, partial [Bacteroidota bacterium]
GQRTEQRRVGEFTGIEVGGIFSVEITQGRSSRLEIKACPDALEAIKASVRDGVLHVKMDDWDGGKDCKATLYITVGELEYLNLSGASNTKTTNTLRQRDMKLEISGAAKLHADMNVEDFDIHASGAANITLNGKSEDLDMDMSGAAKVAAYDFSARKVDADMSGAANVEISVREYIQADMSGAANIRYRGNPEVHQEVSGMASISQG